jgi:hypothetical protein
VPEELVPVDPDGVVALPVPVPGVVEVPPGFFDDDDDVGGMSVVPVGASVAHPDSIPADKAAPIRMTTHFFIVSHLPPNCVSLSQSSLYRGEMIVLLLRSGRSIKKVLKIIVRKWRAGDVLFDLLPVVQVVRDDIFMQKGGWNEPVSADAGLLACLAYAAASSFRECSANRTARPP